MSVFKNRKPEEAGYICLLGFLDWTESVMITAPKY